MTPAAQSSTALGSYEPALDGLRGVCIAAVLAFHTFAFHRFDRWVRGGFIGVSVFFTLSGFLIASVLLREQSATGGLALRRFWARRIRRLWPASFVVIAVVLVGSITGPFAATATDLAAATWNVTNWRVIAGGQHRLLQTIVGPLGPTWSLAVEEQFYIALALTMLVVGRLRRGHRALLVVSLCGIALAVLLANIATDWQPSLEFNTVLRMPELLMGVALAAWRHGGNAWRPSRAAADVIAAIGLCLLVGCFMLADYTPPWLLRGGYTLVAIVTAATIVGLLEHGAMARLIGAGPLRWLGRTSYSLYLVHWPVIIFLTHERTGLGEGSLVVLSAAVAVVLAWGLHVAVEQPVRRLDTAPLPTIAAGVVVGLLLTAAAIVAL